MKLYKNPTQTTKKNFIISLLFITSIFFTKSVSFGSNIEIGVELGNIRKGPEINQKVIGTARKGEVYKILDTTDKWYKIKYGDTKSIGWIHKNLLIANNNSKNLNKKTLNLNYKNSWIFVIGISNYKELDHLNYAVEDSIFFEEKIKKYGFNKKIIFHNENATKKKTVDMLTEILPKKVEKEDRLIIFFAGRTFTKEKGSKKTGYLGTYDTQEKNIFQTSISMDELKSAVKKINAKQILLIIDSAFSGIGTSSRKGPPYYKNPKKLNEVITKKGIQIIVAGRDFEPMDLYGSKSTFIKIFFKGLEGDSDKNLDGIITANEIGSYLHSRVSYETNSKQFPQFGRWAGKGEIAINTPKTSTNNIQKLYEMIFIPGGDFEMGTPGRIGRKSEKPLHKVYLNPFYIGKYEVTNYQYRHFVSDSDHRKPDLWEDSDYNKAKQPVVGVSWHDASSFCRWLGKRLPTEAEWEKAARGADWQKYPWGGDSPSARGIERANLDDKIGNPSQVGKYKAGRTPYGGYDMAGNVWEWVSDWFRKDYYKNSPKDNPPGPKTPGIENVKILRGGSWNSTPFFSRSSYRNWLDSNNKNKDIGFRCADG